MSMDDKSRQSLSGAKVAFKGKDRMGDVYVLDYADQHRVLTFESIYEQSRMDRRRPYAPVHEYAQAMMMVLAFIKPQSAMVLGLGAGCLVRALHRFDSRLQLEAVEIRELVAAVADEYFGLPISDKVRVTVADAEKRLQEREAASASIIFADMYEAYDMHPAQKQVPFIAECYRVLGSHGWLVINFHTLPNPNSSALLALQSFFQELLVCVVPDGNCIVFAGKQPLDQPLVHYREKLKPVEQKLGIALDSLFQRLGPWRDKAARKKKSGRKILETITDADFPVPAADHPDGHQHG